MFAGCDRPSYVEGRLRLAEKERQRVKSKGAAGAAQTGPSQEELAALEVQANANMAALLQEEEVKKVQPGRVPRIPCRSPIHSVMYIIKSLTVVQQTILQTVVRMGWYLWG